jgi:hypothetical protein
MEALVLTIPTVCEPAVQAMSRLLEEFGLPFTLTVQKDGEPVVTILPQIKRPDVPFAITVMADQVTIDLHGSDMRIVAGGRDETAWLDDCRYYLQALLVAQKVKVITIKLFSCVVWTNTLIYNHDDWVRLYSASSSPLLLLLPLLRPARNELLLEEWH